MRSEFLPFSPPWVGQEEIDEVADTLRSGWLSTGPKTRLFEQRFAARLNAPEALALNSCTAGYIPRWSRWESARAMKSSLLPLHLPRPRT